MVGVTFAIWGASEYNNARSGLNFSDTAGDGWQLFAQISGGAALAAVLLYFAL